MGVSRSSSIPEVSRFSSIQKSSKMILLRPALALLPFLFSCGFSAHISSTTTTTPCPLGLQSETTGSPTGSPRSRRSSSHSVSTWNEVVNGRTQTIRVEVRDEIETKEVTEDGRLISKTVNGRNVLSSTTESGWLNPCSLELDCPEGLSSQTMNGECQCVPTGSPTGPRKKRSPGSVYLSPCPHGLWCPRGRIPVHIVDGECQCVRTGSPRSRRSSSVDSNLTVDCGGGHYAPSCEECTQGKGSEGCNGECVWIGEPDNTGLCKSDIVSGER